MKYGTMCFLEHIKQKNARRYETSENGLHFTSLSMNYTDRCFTPAGRNAICVYICNEPIFRAMKCFLGKSLQNRISNSE